MLPPVLEETDPCHAAECIPLAGESDSAAVWNVYTLTLDSDRVDELVWSWCEEGGAEESLPNSETADAA